MGTIAVVFGGPSPEHDVSVLTGLQSARALVRSGRACLPVYWAKSGGWFAVDPALEATDFLEGVPRKAKPVALRVGTDPGLYDGKKRIDVDAVVNCCHGGPGEDGTVSALFELAGLRYTGPGVADGVLGMDKYAFGGLVAAAGLPTLPRRLAGDSLDGVPAPYIVKPRSGGSSLGIAIAEDAATVDALVAGSPLLRDGAVVEPYLPGSRDLNIAVRSWPELALSAIEEPHRQGSGEILDYDAKYKQGRGLAGAARDLPATLDGTLADRIRALATGVARLVPVRSIARLDFLLAADGALYVNEINTIPGVLASYLWVDPPVPFEQLLSDLVAEAVQRPRRQLTTTGADGTVLRAAQSIAAKLGF